MRRANSVICSPLFMKFSSSALKQSESSVFHDHPFAKGSQGLILTLAALLFEASLHYQAILL